MPPGPRNRKANPGRFPAAGQRRPPPEHAILDVGNSPAPHIQRRCHWWADRPRSDEPISSGTLQIAEAKRQRDLRLKQKRWCGMSARVGTVLSGVFTVMATNLYFIFEQKYLKRGNCTEEIHEDESVITLISQKIKCWSWNIAFFLLCVTMLVCCLLLYSVYAQKFRGLVIYVFWIVFYEAGNVVVQIVTNSDIGVAGIIIMRWFGLVSRGFMQCFLLFYVVTYARIIYKSQNRGVFIPYSRHVSTGNEESTRRISKLISVAHHYNE
ncbi:transmembrane protein 217-like [Rhynchonycteris naso]